MNLDFVGRMLNKRGNVIATMILIPIILAVIITSMIIAKYAWDQMSSIDEIFEHDDSTRQVKESTSTAVDMYPFIFVMVVASLFVLLAVSAHYIKTSGVYLVVGIIVLFITITISVPIENYYDNLRNEPAFSDFIDSDYAVPSAIMGSLPFVVLIAGAIFLIVMWSKKKFGADEGYNVGGFG